MNLNITNIAISFVIIILLSLTSCTEEKKDYLIEEEEMVAILVDMHLADGMLSVQPFSYDVEELRSENVYSNILETRGVSRSDFDSALVQYTQDRDLYMKMYEKVIEKLKTKENLILTNVQAKKEQEWGYAFFEYSFSSDFEKQKTIDKSQIKSVTTEKSKSGKYSYKNNKQELSQSYSTIIKNSIKEIEVNLETYINWDKKLDKFPKIVFLLEDFKGKQLSRQEYNCEDLKDNVLDWKQIKLKYRLSISNSQKNVRFSMFFWSPDKIVYYLDDYSLKIKQLK